MFALSDPVETELKLDFAVGDLAAILDSPLLASSSAKTVQLVSRYFDTDTLAMRKAGYSLRIRDDQTRHVQTLKAESRAAAGLFVRSEWERTATGDRPVADATSGPLARLLLEAGEKSLGVCFTARVAREIRVLDRDDALIEVAIDHGEIVGTGKNRVPISEIELELVSGRPEALFALARAIDQVRPLRLGVRSKSERGYTAIAADPPAVYKAEPIILDEQANAGEAFQAIAGSCLRQYRLNEDLVLLSGAAEPLHQARVAIRRLRSAFSLFKPLFARDDRAESLRTRLKALADTLGAVRNLDVMIDRIEGEGAKRLQAERTKAMRRAKTTLEGAETRGLMLALSEWLACGAWLRDEDGDAPRLEPAIDHARAILDHRRNRLKRRSRELADLDADPRHQVRIEAKKLRYASEFFSSLFQSPQQRRRHKRFTQALEELQDALGILNDRYTGTALLAELGLPADTLPEDGRSEQKLLKRAAQLRDVLVDTKRFWRGGSADD
jgi:inorganic triphosphatase YgiF